MLSRRGDTVSIWAAADIFCSLSDNIQESFGLTVIEAMAAGLPVVASNWDGYREAIQHGIKGFLIDSYFPNEAFIQAAYRYINGIDNYDFYIGGLSQLCFVDIEKTAEFLGLLVQDASLRARLADAARKTVAERFEWKTVMPRYFELWTEQKDRISQARAEGGNSSTTWKILAPGYTFAKFPSHRLRGDELLSHAELFSQWSDLIKRPGVILNDNVLCGRMQLQLLHKIFSDKLLHAVNDVLGRVLINPVL